MHPYYLAPEQQKVSQSSTAVVVLCDFIEVLLLELLSYWIPMNPGSVDTSHEDV